MSEFHTRKLLIILILTLNNSFADYDFRDLKPEDFVREASLEMVRSPSPIALSQSNFVRHWMASFLRQHLLILRLSSSSVTHSRTRGSR